jgi:hypothetical protein
MGKVYIPIQYYKNGEKYLIRFHQGGERKNIQKKLILKQI